MYLSASFWAASRLAVISAACWGSSPYTFKGMPSRSLKFFIPCLRIEHSDDFWLDVSPTVGCAQFLAPPSKESSESKTLSREIAADKYIVEQQGN